MEIPSEGGEQMSHEDHEHKNRSKLFNIAFGLSLFTIVSNLIEGTVSTWLGYEDETLALFGFGIDSFIEVISATGIAHMIIRIRKNPLSSPASFERTALRITGVSFFLLAAGLTITAIISFVQGSRPETTRWGIVISLISISVMVGLVAAKRKVGGLLNSQPIIADAGCTLACVYMSVVLLISSVAYELTGIGFLDSLGAVGIAWFSVREGKEAFEKAASGDLACSSCGDHCS